MKYIKPISLLALSVFLILGYQNCSEDLSGASNTVSSITPEGGQTQNGIITWQCTDETVAGGNSAWSHTISFNTDTTEFVGLKTVMTNTNQNPSLHQKEWVLSINELTGCQEHYFTSGDLTMNQGAGQILPFEITMRLCVRNGAPSIQHYTTLNGTDSNISPTHCPTL